MKNNRANQYHDSAKITFAAMVLFLAVIIFESIISL